LEPYVVPSGVSAIRRFVDEVLVALDGDFFKIYAEREAAMTMVVRPSRGSRRLTLGADKAYDLPSTICATSTSRRTASVRCRTPGMELME
jgi:hypothetical protein